MIMSPFTPLFFPSVKADGIESEYIQTFSTKDEILVELLGMPAESPDFSLYSEPDHRQIALPKFETYTLNSSVRLTVCKFKLNAGYYSVVFEGKRSSLFQVTDDEYILQNTVLIQYSAADNRTRADVVGTTGTSRLIFSFRVLGGFKDSGWTFSVDNEQFACADSDIIELYGRESTQKVLTIGGSAGVPIWFGQMINRILTCKYVYIDGMRYVRFESSVPEKEQVLESVNSFVFSQKVQQVNHISPTIESIL